MFVRVCVLAVAAFGLTGCDEITDTVSNGLSRISAPQEPLVEGVRTFSLLGGDVVVRGPEGYCVDQAASNARRGFAVLAGCALISDEMVEMSNLDGLITVQIGAEDTASVTGNEEAFAAFLATDMGRGLLAFDGGLTSIGDVSTITDEAGVLARFEDTSGPLIEGTTGPQWRGFLDVNGRLVTVSVLSFDRNTLSRSEGERLLVVAMAELAEVNAETRAAEEETPVAEENG